MAKTVILSIPVKPFKKGPVSGLVKNMPCFFTFDFVWLLIKCSFIAITLFEQFIALC